MTYSKPSPATKCRVDYDDPDVRWCGRHGAVWPLGDDVCAAVSRPDQVTNRVTCWYPRCTSNGYHIHLA